MLLDAIYTPTRFYLDIWRPGTLQEIHCHPIDPHDVGQSKH
jgi:hypothetical protein